MIGPHGIFHAGRWQQRQVSRRGFFVASGALAAAAGWKRDPLLAFRYQAQQQFGDLRVTSIETHEIGL